MQDFYTNWLSISPLSRSKQRDEVSPERGEENRGLTLVGLADAGGRLPPAAGYFQPTYSSVLHPPSQHRPHPLQNHPTRHLQHIRQTLRRAEQALHNMQRLHQPVIEHSQVPDDLPSANLDGIPGRPGLLLKPEQRLRPLPGRRAATSSAGSRSEKTAAGRWPWA